MKKTLFVAFASLLILSACTTAGSINAGIENLTESEQFNKLCRIRAFAMATFELLRVDVQISDAITAKVYAASASMKSVCDSKPTNIIEALAELQRQYVIITTVSAQIGNSTVVAIKAEN